MKGQIFFAFYALLQVLQPVVSKMSKFQYQPFNIIHSNHNTTSYFFFQNRYSSNCHEIQAKLLLHVLYCLVTVSSYFYTWSISSEPKKFMIYLTSWGLALAAITYTLQIINSFRRWQVSLENLCTFQNAYIISQMQTLYHDCHTFGKQIKIIQCKKFMIQPSMTPYYILMLY